VDQNKPAPKLPDEDRSVKKPGISEPTSHPISETLYTLTRTFACYDAGLAQASAEAWLTFHDNIKPDNITTPGTANGIFQGLLAGNRRFFEVLAQTLSQDCDETESADAPSSTAKPTSASAPISSADQQFAHKVRRTRTKRQGS
jgi:hypothetical protein